MTVTFRGTTNGGKGNENIILKIGARDNATMSVADVLWPLGGATYSGWYASPQALEVVSSSGDDTELGTGARTVIVNGLDAAGVLAAALVVLDGMTPVPIPTPATWLRVFRAIVPTAGSGQKNAGNIDIRVTGGGAVSAQIPIGVGNSAQATWTTPIRKNGYLLGWNGAVGRSAGGGSFTVDYLLMARPNGGAEILLDRRESRDGMPFRVNYTPSEIFLPELADLWITAEASTSNLNLTGGFEVTYSPDTATVFTLFDESPV